MVSDLEDDNESVFFDEEPHLADYIDFPEVGYDDSDDSPHLADYIDFPEVGYDDSDDSPGSDDTFDSIDAYAYDDEMVQGGNSETDDLFDSLRIAHAATEKEKDSQVVQLEDGLWDSLPLELVDKILEWLPLTALFRFRCVCKGWRSLLSSPEWLSHYVEARPRHSCVVMCDVRTSSVRFFFHSDHKWFKIPLYPINSLELEWEFVDTDVGLVCYHCEWHGRPWLCLGNPLTKSFKVIPSNYPSDLDEEDRICEMVKLHVNRQTKNFKVVLLVSSNNRSTTLVYDSTTSLWSDCHNYPGNSFYLSRFFTWKNVIYTQCLEPKILLAFDMESGLWSEVETEFPWHPMTEYFVVNHNDSILLIQLKTSAEECISVWKLQDEASDFSRSSWTEVPLNVPSALKPLLKDFTTCASQGDWIFFTNDLTNRWVKYTFATKSWEVMPCLKTRRTLHRWLDWEPRLDVNVESDLLQNSEQLIFESHMRWRI